MTRRSCTLHSSFQSVGIDCSSQKCTTRTLTNQNQSKEHVSHNLIHNALAQAYREPGEIRPETKQLTRRFGVGGVNERRLLSQGLRDNIEVYNSYRREDRYMTETSEDTASDTTDIFDDCASQFSEDNPHTLIGRLGAQFTNRMSPDEFFKTPLTFVGEQYTVETWLGEPAAVVAMTEIHCSSVHRLQRYFLIYAEAPRLWRRITVSATILRSSRRSVDSKIAAPDHIFSTFKTLPGNIQYQLQALLKNLTFIQTVTEISLNIAEDSQRNYILDVPSVVISEDPDESYTNDEEEMLQAIEHMNFPQYLQNEVIVQRRIDAVTYVAQVESRPCMERKKPFSGGGLPGDSGLERFWQDLKLAKSLYQCNGVVKFMGVVLDDSRKHIASFLQELPTLGTIRSILADAELRKERIPWSVRETWASQIITAVAEVHAKGFVVGMLHIEFISIRSDGSAVLSLRKRGYKHSINHGGEIAPESRTVPTHSPQFRELDFSSDIFMLGMLLWLLAEHRYNIHGYMCLRNACTSVPRHSCKAEHMNPVDLPPVIDKEVPEAFNAIISLCRQADLKKRPPARTLLQYLSAKGHPLEMADLEVKYANARAHLVFCDECGTGTRLEISYHCNVCKLADFDLCRRCVSQGIHCFDKEHRLVERVYKNGEVRVCQEQ